MDADRVRELLDQERERLLEVQGMLKHEHLDDSPEEESSGELSTYDQHQADVASDVFEREKEFSLLARVRLDLRDVDDAVARLGAGRYGTCQSCGAVIEDDRLEAMPATRFCIDHQSFWEAVRMTLTPPPGPMPGERRGTLEHLTELSALLNLDLLNADDELEERLTLSAEEAALRFHGPHQPDGRSHAARVEEAEARHFAEGVAERAPGERADEEWTDDLGAVLAEEERLGPAAT